MKLRPNQVKRGCKGGPTGPRRMIQSKTREPKRSTKCSVREAMKPPWPQGTTGHGSCHDRGATFRPGCFVFLYGFSFSCAIFQYVLLFWLYKKGVSSLIERRIHSLETFKLYQKSIEEGETRRRGIRQKATGWKQIERSTF